MVDSPDDAVAPATLARLYAQPCMMTWLKWSRHFRPPTIESEISELRDLASKHLGLRVKHGNIDRLIEEKARQSDSTIRKAYPQALRIFEEGIGWLIALYIALGEARTKLGEEHNLNSPWALVGAACAYAVSVRRLVLSGLDGPARAVLRSLAETVFLCVVLLHRDDVRTGYEAAGRSGDEYSFWKQNLRTRTIEAHLAEIESHLPQDMVDELAAWRHEQLRLLSSAVHLSYTQAVLTAMPPWDDMHSAGGLGSPSLGSPTTLTEGTKLIWYFAVVAGHRLINSPDSPVGSIVGSVDDRGHWWDHVITGQTVLIALVTNHFLDVEGPRYTPSS